MFSLMCMMVTMSAVGHSDATLQIAVVNVAKASELYKKTNALEQQFETSRKAFNETRQAKEQEIQRLAKAIEEQFKPGSDDFKARQRDLFVLQAEYESWMKDEGGKLQASVAASLRTIYDDITAMTSIVAQERNIDLVLPIEPMPDEIPTDPTILRQQIMFQKVLYASNRIDLTAEVVRRLNAAFEQRGSASDPDTTVKLATAAE